MIFSRSMEPSPPPLPRRPVRIVDMARELALSPSAVSQALRSKPGPYTRVSPETVVRVRALADAWGYRPNSSARVMKGRALQQAGFLVAYNQDRHMPWVEFPGILGISDHLTAHGWNLHIVPRNSVSENSIPPSLREQSLDGLIVSASGDDAPLLAELAKYRIPCVLLNGDAPVNTIVLNDKAGAAMATRHLLELGHRHILYVGAARGHHPSVSAREAGYSAAMAEAGFAPHVWNYPTRFPEMDTPEIVRHEGHIRLRHEFYTECYLKHRPTGIVFYSDLDAMRASQVLQEHGVRIPGDVSIVGYDSLPFADLHSPSLTTIRSDFYAMGVAAADMLLRLIQEPETPIPSVWVDPTMVVRRSAAAPAA